MSTPKGASRIRIGFCVLLAIALTVLFCAWHSFDAAADSLVVVTASDKVAAVGLIFVDTGSELAAPAARNVSELHYAQRRIVRRINNTAVDSSNARSSNRRGPTLLDCKWANSLSRNLSTALHRVVTSDIFGERVPLMRLRNLSTPAAPPLEDLPMSNTSRLFVRFKAFNVSSDSQFQNRSLPHCIADIDRICSQFNAGVAACSYFQVVSALSAGWRFTEGNATGVVKAPRASGDPDTMSVRIEADRVVPTSTATGSCTNSADGVFCCDSRWDNPSEFQCDGDSSYFDAVTLKFLQIQHVFRHYGLFMQLTRGSLLAAVRNRTLIPSCSIPDDIDGFISQDVRDLFVRRRNKVPTKTMLDVSLRRLGVYTHLGSDNHIQLRIGSKSRRYNTRKCSPRISPKLCNKGLWFHLDLWPLVHVRNSVGGGDWLIYNESTKGNVYNAVYHADRLLDVAPLPLTIADRRFVVDVPKDSKALLDGYYGTAWRVPASFKNKRFDAWHHFACVAGNTDYE
jgi:hypothetical protein